MKHRIRKLMCVMMIVMLLMPTALAEETLSLSGALQPADIELVTAPMSGSVLKCTAQTGDLVEEGGELLTIDTVRIYAPCDGVAAGLRAQEGDSLNAINAFYGAAMYIEPSAEYVIQATTTNAYDSNDNRMIHVGEKVYLTSVNNSSRKGEGIVTFVDGENYTVEVTDSNIRLNETCRISRDDDSSVEKGRIGQGKTRRNNPVAVTAEGSVIKLHVSEGDEVKMGDLLMEIAPDRPDGKTESVLIAQKKAVVLSMLVTDGSAVQKGQGVARVFSELQAVVQISEDDLLNIQIGDVVNVLLDIDPEEYKYKGTVEKISYVPLESALGGVMYEMTVSFKNDDFVRMGMSVTVETIE